MSVGTLGRRGGQSSFTWLWNPLPRPVQKLVISVAAVAALGGASWAVLTSTYQPLAFGGGAGGVQTINDQYGQPGASLLPYSKSPQTVMESMTNQGLFPITLETIKLVPAGAVGPGFPIRAAGTTQVAPEYTRAGQPGFSRRAAAGLLLRPGESVDVYFPLAFQGCLTNPGQASAETVGTFAVQGVMLGRQLTFTVPLPDPLLIPITDSCR